MYSLTPQTESSDMTMIMIQRFLTENIIQASWVQAQQQDCSKGLHRLLHIYQKNKPKKLSEPVNFQDH